MRISSGKKTKHISSHCFPVTCKIAKGELDMVYFPTEKTWCDILNKPKQGAPYWLDHSHFMNVPVDYDDKVERKANHPAL